MPNRYALAALTAIALLSLVATEAPAQLYAGEWYPGNIVSYEDTVGTVVNPDTLISDVTGMALDHEGRILLSTQNGVADVIRFDPVTQTVEELDAPTSGALATDVCTDLGDGIYVLKTSNWKGRGGRQYESWIGYLPGGVGPAQPVYLFPDQDNLLDIQVWPFGDRAGNVLVLADYDGPHLFEFEPTPGGTLAFVQEIAGGGMMPTNARGFAITPTGTINVVDYAYGLYYIDEYYGYVWGFGSATNVGYNDIEIDASGDIYLANTDTDQIERFDSSGLPIGSPFGGGITSLGAICVAGFTPTPEGEDVLVEPAENIEITYEEVNSSGYTTASITTTADRVSPEGNDLPPFAQLPGTRATEFDYIFLATDAVYSGLIQVDVLEEGSRLFYASGTSDTFRDFTVEGSIEDARGTIPRFTELTGAGSKRVETGPTEVVLVEDTRSLTEVTLYKFWRLNLAMEVPDNMPGGDPCPWEYIEWLQKYPKSARAYYDLGQYTNALSELAIMNGLIRSHAGWCIPDSSDDPLGNMVAHILAHSKTLMWSISNEGGTLTGVDTPAALALSVTSPARGECVLALSGPAGTEVAARIYDVAGRLVTTVFEGALPEGGLKAVWNGLDDSGHHIASGVYFARAESSDGTLTSKVVFIR
jgi:hypothetical protein